MNGSGRSIAGRPDFSNAFGSNSVRSRSKVERPSTTEEFELREPLKSFASEKYTVGLNGFVEFEMLSEPHVSAGDSIQIDACEPG